MDVGNFIGELLTQNGEVNVPGLGSFAYTRVNGHYNEQDGIIYPPAYSIQFDQQLIEDETLAHHIADRKNISLASSKYFIEKFINTIKLQAQNGETSLADLGWLYTENNQLYFKPNTSINTDPEFFGYQPLKINKLNTAPAEVQAPFTAPPAQEYIAAPVAVKQQEEPVEGNRYEADEEHEAYLVSLTRKRKVKSTIIFVVLAILFTALVIYLVNRYDPQVFKLGGSPKSNITQSEQVINAKVIPVEDTLAKDTTKKDSVPAATVPAVADTVSKTNAVNNIMTGPRYEIMAGAFYTVAKANLEILKYEKMGLDAYIIDSVPGKKIHISLGAFKTKAEATAAKTKILNTGKVKPNQIYILPFDVK